MQRWRAMPIFTLVLPLFTSLFSLLVNFFLGAFVCYGDRGRFPGTFAIVVFLRHYLTLETVTCGW